MHEDQRKTIKSTAAEAIIAKDSPADAARATRIRESLKAGDDATALYLMLQIVSENGTFT